MRVVWDCRSVFAGMGGIGRASAELARHLGPALAEHHVVLLLGARSPHLRLNTAPNVTTVDTGAAMIDPAFEQIRLPGLLDELRADVYHNSCFSVPLARGLTKRVATVHDVVFAQRPELVEPQLGSYLARWTEVSCEVAEAVVTVSQFSKGELARTYGRMATAVISNGVDDAFQSIGRRESESGPIILYVGSVEPKKNVDKLVAGFVEALRREPLPHDLVLAGATGPDADVERLLPRAALLRNRIRLLGHVPEPRLHDLYGEASVFAYLSEYEGFGLPPLEAMAAGIPCLVSDRGALPEVVGDGALIVDPDDPHAVADALIRLATDRDLRVDLVERGQRVARRFTWERAARDHAQLYERLHAGASGEATA